MAGKNGRFNRLLKGSKICLGINDYKYFKEKDKEVERKAIETTIGKVMV